MFSLTLRGKRHSSLNIYSMQWHSGLVYLRSATEIAAKQLWIIAHVVHKDFSSNVKGTEVFSLYLCAEHQLIGSDSHFIFLTVGKVGAQWGSVPLNGSPGEGRNRVL